MSIEAGLRKTPELRGTIVTLCNGEEWTVASIPLSKKGIDIARQMDELQNSKDLPLSETMSKFFEFAKALLRLNYPALSDEQAEELFDMSLLGDFMGAATGGLSEGNAQDPQT